jgi:hypothetical protein
MVERPSILFTKIFFFFFKKKKKTDKILTVRLEGLFWSWNAPSSLGLGFGLCRLHTMDVQVKRPWEVMAKGLDFGLDLWKLESHFAWP